MLDSPLDLYHGLEGGTIASQRPPPPGIGQPYPELGTVPGRPTPTSAADRKSIYAALAAERDRVTRQNSRDPLAIRPEDMPPSPSAVPAPAAVQPGAAQPKPAAAAAATPPSPAAAAAADESAPSVAVLPAADAPPAKPAPNAPRPAGPLGPLPDLQTAAAVGGPVPPLPDKPPPAPALEGVPPPPAPPGSVDVVFRPGSAVVPLGADVALRQLAAERHDRAVDVRAPGGTPVGSGSDGRAAALALGLRRAQAIAAVLAEAGVPPGSLRVLAEGAGQAGVARLMDRN